MATNFHPNAVDSKWSDEEVFFIKMPKEQKVTKSVPYSMN